MVGVTKGARSSPVLARKPSRRLGWYCIRLGQVVALWADTAGSPTGPPLSHRAVMADAAAAAVVATVALGMVLLCLAWARRWVLDRRRLADWEAASGCCPAG